MSTDETRPDQTPSLSSMSPLPGEQLHQATDLFQALAAAYQTKNAPNQNTQHLEILESAQPLLDFFREEMVSNPPTTSTAFNGYVILTLADGTRVQLGAGEGTDVAPGSTEPTTSIRI